MTHNRIINSDVFALSLSAKLLLRVSQTFNKKCVITQDCEDYKSGTYCHAGKCTCIGGTVISDNECVTGVYCRRVSIDLDTCINSCTLEAFSHVYYVYSVDTITAESYIIILHCMYTAQVTVVCYGEIFSLDENDKPNAALARCV